MAYDPSQNSQDSASWTTTPKAIADHIVGLSGDHTICIGPMCWKPSDGMSARLYRFYVASIDAEGHFQVDQLFGDADDRAALVAALASHRGLLVCLFEDDLEMAKWCEALWPQQQKIVDIRKAIEAERHHVS